MDDAEQRARVEAARKIRDHEQERRQAAPKANNPEVSHSGHVSVLQSAVNMADFFNSTQIIDPETADQSVLQSREVDVLPLYEKWVTETESIMA